MPYEVGYLIRLSNTGEECERIAVSNEDHFIGSGNACQIKIFGDDTPAKYCVIKTINNLTSVHNLNLRNPVSVNNEAVLEVDRIIQNGDELLILDQVFRWNYVEKPRCFRSLPAEHSVVAQPVERYSLPSGCLKSTDNEDNSEMKQPESTSSNDEVKIKQFENSTSLDIQSVEEIPTATPEPLVKRPYISTSCKIDRSSLGRENKAERLTQTSVKSRTSRTILSKESVNMKKSSDVKLGKKPHTLKTPTKKVNNTPCKSMNTPPFSVSNTFINESKKGITSFCKDSKVESECNVKSILEGTSDEDIISNQPASQPYHSTPNPSASKKSVDAKSSLSSSVDFDFEISQDDLSKLKATSFTVSRNADETVEQNVRSEHNTNVNLSNTTPVKSMKSRISAKNVCSRDFTPKKASSEISRQDSSNLHISTSKIEEGKGDTMSKSANVSALKKSSECLNESRRNTRGRTSILRKTFEEKAHQDNTLNKEKSLTTPEKSIETSKTATLNVESVTESSVNLKAQPSLNGESSKCEFASVSDENDTCENSFIDKYKICNYLNISNGSSATVAKCARNLSYFSPPENNRSQEYMDSIASTPKKVLSPSTHDNNDSYNVSLSSFVSPSKDSSLNESILSPLSSARKRRSTGFVPFVGTPSNVYRVNRKISTPFSKSRLDRTSADFESVEQSSRGAKWSSERRSTPFKVATRKSSMRDSILMHSTIEENELSKDDEDESMNDPKFKYVTTRRQRRCVESSFASENFILEESEPKNDDTDSVLAATTAEEEEENDDGDDEDIETFDDVNSETPMSMRITVNNMSTLENSVDVSKLDKTPLLGSKKVAELKSILTPLPKLPCSVVKKSAKKVTFELPDSPASLNLKENTFDCEEAESVLMQSTNEINSSQEGTEQEITNDEETENVENDVSCDSFSYTENPEEISASQSDDEKQEKSSLNETVSLNTTCSSEVNVSGVERIESPNRSKVLHDHEVSIASVNDATVWKGQVNMPDVGTFDTVLSKVCGDCEHLTGLRSNIECVGRVNPNTVWENLRAIKENENMAVSVLRFESPQPDQIDNYMTLFDDLYAKDRLAVISDVGDGIENFYIMALPCHTSMPDILPSNDAASELVYETDSLLAIIVRNYNVKDTRSLPSASASVSNEKSVDKLLESTKQDLFESTNEVFIEAKQNESPDLRDAESMITSPRYASSVCLSGIKSLLTTPIETPDCKITKNKATNKMDENDDEMISSANTFSPEACLSGVKSLLKTPEISQSSAIKAGKRILNFEPDSPKSVVDVVPSPGPIRKSMPNCPQKRTSISRSCKSLGANKNTERKKSVAETEAKLDLEREQPMDIPIIKITEATFVEECRTVESCESETAVDKLVEIESAGRVEESSSGKLSPEQAEMTDKLSQLEDTLVEETDRVENLTNGVLPETTSDGLSHEHAETIDPSSQLENTRVEKKSSDYQLSEDLDGGSSPKQMEMVNECVESQNIENEEKCSSHQSSEDFSDRLSPQHVQGEQFQTSDHEETLSSEDGVLDRERSVSPVISPRRHRSTSKISLLMLANEENMAKNLNVSAFVDVHEETSKLSNLSTEGSSNRTEGSEEITENDLSKRSFDVIAKEGNDTRLLNSPYVNVTKTVVDLKENSTAAESSLDDEPLEANDFGKTKTPKSSDILNGSESELENTQNSQDIYMKLDVSSDLINDLNEQLGSAYCSSNEPTKPNSPVGPKSHEMFKVPASVDLTSRLLDVSNMEEINDVTRDVETPGYDTTNTSNHLVNNCSISKSAMNKTCYTPFNKFKTSITSESCSSASPVRRCRKSGRIHSLRVDDSQNLDITDKDCSILSNNSSTHDIFENNEDPKQLYRHVVQELSIKTISIKEKLDEQCCLEVSQTSDHGNIPRAGESNNVISAESDQQIISDTESANISAIIDADTSSPANPSDQIQSNVSSCNETQITSSQNESNVGEVGSPQPESTVENHQSMVNCENNLEIATPLVQNAGESDSVSRTVLVDEICVVSEASQNEIPPIVIDKLTVPMDENTDVVEKPIPKKKRNLRVRKDEHSSEMENESGNEVGTVTRNRRKRVSETKKLQTSLKPNSKKATERNQIHDDKENVCSLTGVLRKPQSKKMKLSEHENDAMVQSLADKKAKKQLQNVENTVVPEPPIQRSRRIVKKTSPATSHTKRKRSDSPGKNECKKPCSILLPLLDPEIINSPVKVDDAGNITIIKESPELPTKRVRSGRPAKKVAAAVPMEGKQDELAQPTSARVTKQRQTKTVTFDKKSPPTTRRKMAVVKNPVVAEIAESASVAPRVLRKHAEVKKEPETKTKSKRSAKDSCESIEEVVVEPPKRTRGRPKTVTVPESQPICLPENANGRPKRGVKHIVVDVEPEPKNIRKAKSVKKTEAVEEASAGSEASEKNSKNVKINKQLRVLVDDIIQKEDSRRVTRARPANVDPAEETVNSTVSSKLISKKAKVIKKSKDAEKSKTASPRITRTKKNEAGTSAKVDNAESNSVSSTSSRSVRKPAQTKRSHEQESDVSVSKKNVTKKPTPSKNIKRVITRSKRLSLTNKKKGRVSLTLNTASQPLRTQIRKTRASRMVTTAVSAQGNVSSPEVAVTNSRITRKRAK